MKNKIKIVNIVNIIKNICIKIYRFYKNRNLPIKIILVLISIILVTRISILFIYIPYLDGYKYSILENKESILGKREAIILIENSIYKYSYDKGGITKEFIYKFQSGQYYISSAILEDGTVVFAESRYLYHDDKDGNNRANDKKNKSNVYNVYKSTSGVVSLVKSMEMYDLEQKNFTNDDKLKLGNIWEEKFVPIGSDKVIFFDRQIISNNPIVTGFRSNELNVNDFTIKQKTLFSFMEPFDIANESKIKIANIYNRNIYDFEYGPKISIKGLSDKDWGGVDFFNENKIALQATESDSKKNNLAENKIIVNCNLESSLSCIVNRAKNEFSGLSFSLENVDRVYVEEAYVLGDKESCTSSFMFTKKSCTRWVEYKLQHLKNNQEETLALTGKYLSKAREFDSKKLILHDVSIDRKLAIFKVIETIKNITTSKSYVVDMKNGKINKILDEGDVLFLK